MKKLFFLLLFPLLASADNLPEGFEELRWAEPLARIPDAKKLVETPFYQCYRRGEGVAEVGGTRVSNLRLCFSEDRFYFVQMEFGGEKEFAALLAYAKNQWGHPRPVQRSSETYAWGGGEEKIYVELEFSKLDDRGTLAYVYLPVFRETQEAGRRDRKSQSQ
jgi:hypothetical protein